MSSMLHVNSLNCDMRMRWETDILQLQPTTISSNAANGDTVSDEENKIISTLSSESSSDGHNHIQGHKEIKNQHAEETSQELLSNFSGSSEALSPLPNISSAKNDATAGNSTGSLQSPIFFKNALVQQHAGVVEPLTPNEKWTDEVELLRTLLRANGSGPTFSTLKSRTGSLLRATNPARFLSRWFELSSHIALKTGSH